MLSLRSDSRSKLLDKIRLISSFDTVHLGHVENLLHEAGISVEKRNQYASGGVGELSPIDVMPELWVARRAQAQAEAILLQLKKDQEKAATTTWVCPQCGESMGGQFAQCWQCGEWQG